MISPIREPAVVAANEPFDARREDFEADDALIWIAEGRIIAETERRQLSTEHHFKSAPNNALFADLPEASASTVEKRSDAVRPKRCKLILPRFTAEDGSAVDEAAVAPRGRGGAQAPGRNARPCVRHDDRRLPRAVDFELGVIEGMKYRGSS